MANIITIIRIICSIVLLFCPALSFSFYSVYVISGFSDMIDGIIAIIKLINVIFGIKQ